MTEISNELHSKVSKAVAYFWQTRRSQAEKQNKVGTRDQGAGSAVTGGAQTVCFRVRFSIS